MNEWLFRNDFTLKISIERSAASSKHIPLDYMGAPERVVAAGNIKADKSSPIKDHSSAK